MRLIITIGLILISTVAFAQVYEKESDTALKVTAPISTIYDVAKIKERIVDLNDYITVAQAQIIQFQAEIAKMEALLTEATKVGIDTKKEAVVVTP